MKKTFGVFVIILVTITSIVLWFFSKENPSFLINAPLRGIGQLSGLVGFTLISINLILSMKLIFLDKFFGGLDKVFKIHRVVGALGLILLINHPLFFIAEDLPNFKLASLYLIPSGDFAYLLGLIGLYSMILSFIFMVFIKIPYHLWKITHQLLGIAFLSGVLHLLIITSDPSRFLPLKLWVILLSTIGLASFIYSLLLHRLIGPRYFYTISKIERILDIVNVYLTPLGKKMDFQAGQFVYLSFHSKNISKENHPFSLSSAPENNQLRISAKILGDYTLKLPALEEKTTVELFGPFGTFGQECLKNNSQIWVAGGIGITPFLSLLHHLKTQQNQATIHLFYLFRNLEDGVYLSEIQQIAQEIPNFHLHPWCSKQQGKFDIKACTPYLTHPQSTSALLCGPNSLMSSLKKQLIKAGVLEDNIYSEDFNFLDD